MAIGENDIFPKILLTRVWPKPVVNRLRDRYRVTMDRNDAPLDAAALHDAMHSYDAICPTVTDQLDAAMLGTAAPRVRALANFGAGVDHIDLDAAKSAGIVVTNTPDVLTEATAELAVMLMLMAGRRASDGERELRVGRWSGWRPTHLLGTQLHGKTLALVGFGRIGQAVARIARHGFGMRIVYHTRRRVEPPDDLRDAEYAPSLDGALRRADIVSFHCPGGPETNRLLDKRRIGLLKRSAIVVNTARGSVIDEQALVEALRERRIRGAGLDVFQDEPKVRQGLLELENVTLLPHLGSATVETRIAMGMRAADNLDDFFDGARPRDRVV